MKPILLKKPLIFLSFLMLTGCQDKVSVFKSHSEQKALEMLESLDAPSKYYELVEGFSEKTQVVLLAVQGGPLSSLKKNYFKGFHSFFTVVYVHQAQTLPVGESDCLDSRLIDSSQIISVEDARKASLKSAAILYKVTQHFKGQGKAVYLLSHSFGSFLTLYTLVHYGNHFDKILV